MRAAELGGPSVVVARAGPQGEDEPTSLSLLLVPVISLVPPPTTGEMSAKLQAVTALRTLVHGTPWWGSDGLFGAGGGWQMAGSCGVSRASLSQLWGEGRSPACLRGHGWWAEQQLLPLHGGPACAAGHLTEASFCHLPNFARSQFTGLLLASFSQRL